MDMTVELSPDEIKEAIIAYVETNTPLDSPVDMTDITFQVKDSYHSSDPRETTTIAALEGAKVKITSRPNNYMDR